MSLNKKRMKAAVISAVIAGCISVTDGQAFGAQPGSAEDPLVSQSYVDGKINQIMSLITGAAASAGSGSYDEIVSDVMAQIEYLYGAKLNASDTAGVSGQQQTDRYVPVSASPGQVIIGEEGTEIILRSGTAAAYCPGPNGLVDVTDGGELLHNHTVKANHMLIVPRGDGRGVQVQTDAWFIIKGDYSFLRN